MPSIGLKKRAHLTRFYSNNEVRCDALWTHLHQPVNSLSADVVLKLSSFTTARLPGALNKPSMNGKKHQIGP